MLVVGLVRWEVERPTLSADLKCKDIVVGSWAGGLVCCR